MLREQIVPRLKADVPNQPTLEQLEADPLLSRFTIVFDREGYSSRFFAQMKEERIAILTYHKFPGELWPEQEFRTLAFPGDSSSMSLIGKIFGRPKREASQDRDTICWASDKAVRRAARRIFAKYKATVRKLAE